MRILIVDDDTMILKALDKFLGAQLGHDVTVCADPEEALALQDTTPFPLVLSDVRMPGMSGIDLLKRIKSSETGRWTDVVMITAHGDKNTAVNALKGGAYDYLDKPPEVEELAAVVQRVAEHQQLLRENDDFRHRFDEKLEEATQDTVSRLKSLEHAYADVVGIGTIGVFSNAMREIVGMAETFHADRTIPVLIEGETGTGKEIIARLVHHGADNATEPFVTLNCSAIPDNLFESELFGYEGGAFSDADRKGRAGKLEHANGGTVFLDEIGDLPLHLQPKLLRAIQEREIYRIGGLKKITLDVRIICATNHDLAQQVERGSFRRDLYYRLNLGKLTLPPLRERPEAILPLAEMFLKRLSGKRHRKFDGFSHDARDLLQTHTWPGNIRELENAIERAVILHDGELMTEAHLTFIDHEHANHENIEDNPRMVGIYLPQGGFSLETGESALLERALSLFDGNKTKTAEYLGISLSTLKRKIRRMNDRS